MDDRAHLFVRIHADMAMEIAQIADRQSSYKFTATGLLLRPLKHALADDVQFGFGHRAFEPQQQAVIVRRGIVKAIQVANERAE
jgi:hypothetical protein